MAVPDHSFDLLERRRGWTAEEVLVVTPYVEKEFFERLAKGLGPRRLSVIIDDGCRLDDVGMVTAAVAKVGGRTASGLRCVLGSAPGLMHLKLFYIVWRTPGKRTARTLIFGSANATRQGFGGSVNAELIASCNLTANRHAEVIAWCDAATGAARSKGRTVVPAARDVELGKGLHLRLPALSVGRKKSALASFDLWVQRGWLLSEYRPDPGFLRVPITLAKGLSQTDQERLVAGNGFLVPEKKRLTFPYALPEDQVVGDLEYDDGDEVDEIGNWRRKLFVWTQLGEWCSEDCYALEHRHFKKRNHEEREARLRCLETMRLSSVRQLERTRFLSSMARLWADLGNEAGELLRGGDTLDEDYYAEQFDQRVERDLALIGEEEFRHRYLRGYELSPVPRFRPDVLGWRDFLDSLVRQLCLDHTRSRSQSQLLHAVSEAVGAIGRSADVFEKPAELCELLRGLFTSGDAGDAAMARAAKIVTRYHCK
jgi:hypothetical protein